MATIGDCKTDYNTHPRKLENGKMSLAMLNGYWVWWCITHQQPLYKCELDKAKAEAQQARAEAEAAKAETVVVEGS